ncbi:tRNA N(3)-cytidine methyltransferase METTL8, mitochondrial [Aplochiton taeniatus]
MHRLQGIALAVTCLTRYPYRLKSTGRPSAPLGARILKNPEDVFEHNMWDHVQWSEEERELARQKAEENSSVRIPLNEQDKYDTEACKYWDCFYEMHLDKFFKDRKWLFLEFPELLPFGPESITRKGSQTPLQALCTPTHGYGKGTETEQNGKNTEWGYCFHPDGEKAVEDFPGQHSTFRILEVGCGAGNSVFPIVGSIKDTGAFLYCCDFSPRAIQLVKSHPEYNSATCHAFVQDISDEMASFPFPPLTLDVILVVFVLSSIHPKRVQGVVNRLSKYLKYGGVFLFRDYGRHDLAQLRFKKGRCLSENFYTRGDGTCVYFFTKDEVCALFSNAGLEEIQNLEDRRLQVNRGKKVVMHRVWMQSKYKKLQPPPVL